MIETLVRSIGLLLGPEAAKHFLQRLERTCSPVIPLPGEACLSKSRLRLDVLMALTYQARWREHQNSHFIYLSADSSPQGGLDYLMTLQDVCLRRPDPDTDSLVILFDHL